MNIRMKRCIYGKDPFQFGDLRLPEGDGPYPIAIVIHGGFWKNSFGLDLMEPVAEHLTAKGVATWNIEFRRVGDEGGGWPGTFIDVANAADHLQQIAEEQQLDLSQAVAIGHSAGGHLALWLAARKKLPASSVLRTTGQPITLKGVISLAGVNDLALMDDVHHLRLSESGMEFNHPVSNLLGGTPREVPKRYEQASPIQFLPLQIPQVLIHGSLDINVPIGISYSYKRTADAVGDPVKMVEIPSAEHFKIVNPHVDEWSYVINEVTNLLGLLQ
ncbi:alpha/beta hydrolase [Lentibacillus sp. N15]|uniref:alpha/beta hydrolase family protein n=1 Tax=Lentibacillus songyuanensis TaxID=3136161 RepID=UPI0031BAE840